MTQNPASLPEHNQLRIPHPVDTSEDASQTYGHPSPVISTTVTAQETQSHNFGRQTSGQLTIPDADDDYLSTSTEGTATASDVASVYNEKNKRQRNNNVDLDFIITNAQSLNQKYVSLGDAFVSLQLTLGIITETWFKSSELASIAEEILENEFGIKSLRRDRPGKKRGGGVAICYDSRKVTLKENRIKTGGHEILSAAGKLTGDSRVLVVFALYIPPQTKVETTRNILGYVNEAIIQAKIKFKDPHIIIGGDLNQKPFQLAYEDHTDIKELPSPPTRGDKRLDLAATNMHQHLKEVTVSPHWRTKMAPNQTTRWQFLKSLSHIGTRSNLSNSECATITPKPKKNFATTCSRLGC